VRHLEHLRAITVAAAVRGGVELDLNLAVRDGRLCLPTLGSYSLATQWAAELALRVDSGAITVHRVPLDGAEPSGGDDVQPTWRPRRLLAGDGLAFALEDADPYRDCFGPDTPVEPELCDAEALRWQHLFRAAWEIIERDHADYAPGLRAGLSVLVPAVRPAEGLRSATARGTFGAVAVSRPDTPEELVLLLIHEFQHVKLGALLDLFDLYDPEDRNLYPVPWREDERPFEGLLQGTYAFAAAADVWRARWQRGGCGKDSEMNAGAQFVLWRERVAQATEQILGCPSLEKLGRRFFGLLGERVFAWRDEPVPREIRRLAVALADGRAGSR
jgi:uncharacterized protein